MEISDFIPDYPEIEIKNFNQKILEKQEFYELKPDFPQVNPNFYNHQELLGRFLGPNTEYNEMLIMSAMGSGKTRQAILMAESNKNNVVKPMLIIVPNDTLVDQWKREIVASIPEYELKGETETELKKITKINKVLEDFYTITTIERFRRKIDETNGEILNKLYSNTVIIIDEAHNLRIKVGTKDANETTGRYKAYHRFLHTVQNCKILLLTGTPMVDRPSELPGLMNLILPINNQMPIGKEFLNKFFKKDKDEEIPKLINIPELQKYFKGRISYIREGGEFPIRQDLGKNIWTKFNKNVTVQISKTQMQGYTLAYQKDTTSKKKEEKGVFGLWTNSRQAANFVYKTSDNKYIWGKDVTNLMIETGKKRKIIVSGKEIDYASTSIKNNYARDLKENLGEYSAKFKYIIDRITNEKGPFYIYNPMVSGGGGAQFLGNILKLFGYSRALGVSANQSPGKRYAIITGDERSSLQRKKLIDIFNDPENRDGSLIQVMIATKTISEGTNFINVRDIILISPWWNNSITEQAIRRGIRAKSLTWLPLNERIITVAELAITSKNFSYNTKPMNIDATMYLLSENKDYTFKILEHEMKKTSFDCAINYSRNVRSTDTNYSRDCDYTICEYKCTGTTGNYIVKDTDKSTYRLYYFKPQSSKIVDNIKAIFKTRSLLNINGLSNELNTIDFKTVLLALNYLISNNIALSNKFGQTCYLKNWGNTLFLTPNPNSKNWTDWYYTNYPFINQYTNLTDFIHTQELKQGYSIISKINLNKLTQAQELINSLNLESKIFVLEKLWEINKSNNLNQDIKNKLSSFLDLFADNFFIFENKKMQIPKTVIHTLEKNSVQGDNILFIDLTRGDSGEYRCLLDDSQWLNCDKKQSEIFSKQIAQAREKVSENIINNPYKVYGIITANNAFKITDKRKETEKAKKDRRKVYTGKVCIQAGWKHAEVVKLIGDLGITKGLKLSNQPKNKSELKEIAKNIGIKLDGTESLKTLQIISAISKLSKLELCNMVQEFLEENGLIIYES